MARGRDYPVRELRDRLIMTQAELAQAVGVTVGSIARWEAGRSKPTPLAVRQLEALAKKADKLSGEHKAA